MKSRNPRRRAVIHAVVATLAFIMSAGPALAQTLSLRAPVLDNVSGILTTRFGVIVEEKPILKGELEDGLELVLTCDVTLYQVNDYWIDTPMASSSFRSTLKHDSLAKEFVLTLPGRDAPLRSADITGLLDEGWGTIETGLGPWNKLEKGGKYSVILTMNLNEAGAPEGISRFFYFWSWDAGASNTFQLDFTY